MAEKHIEMHLEQGDMKGIVQCTMSGWAGSAYRIPRTLLSEAFSNPELNKSGVYCLVNAKTTQAYVGQGAKRRDDSGVLKRVSRHDLATEAYWDTAIVFVDRYKNLSSTEICYLEHHFYQLAKSAGRFSLANGQVPPDGSPGRGIICDMNCYIAGAKIVMEAMGYNIFEPLTAQASTEPSSRPATKSPTAPASPTSPSPKQPTVPTAKPTTLSMAQASHYTLSRTIGRKSGQNWKVQAQGLSLPDGKFIVLKGSLLSPEQASKPYLSRTLQDLRKAHCLPNDIVTLQQDLEFTSPSAAASFVIGNQVNGKVYWKTAP